MDADSAIHLAPGAKQVPQGEMRLNGAGILFEHVEEQIYRLILLVTQQEVDASHVVTRQPVGLILLCLLRTSASHVPAVGGCHG